MASLEDSLLEGSPLECTICLERMKNISFLSTQPDDDGNFCVHWFCTECIEPYIAKAVDKNQDPKCPSCRRIILGVNRCKGGNELLKEIERERDQRKIITAKKDQTIAELRRQNEELQAENKQLKDSRDQDQQQHNKEMRLVVEQIRKVQGVLEEERKAKEVTSRSANDKIRELSDISDLLRDQLKDEKSKGEEYRSQTERIQKQIEELQNQMNEKLNESEKWRKMYLRAFDELNTKTKQLMIAERKSGGTTSTVQSMSVVSSPSSSSSLNSLTGLASWFTIDKITELSNPLTTYLWGGRTGVLLRNPDDFKFVERRGSSRSSSVWKSFYRIQDNNSHHSSSSSPSKSSPTSANSRIVALKKLNEQYIQSKNLTEAFREAMFLYKLDHKNIIKMEAMIRDQPVPNSNHIISDFIVLTFMELDLEYLLSDQITFRLKAPQIRLILYQILSALYYLHSAETVHRNIQPTSILLDEAINVRLGGFGSARSLHSQPFPTSSTNLSSYRYWPPENAYLSESTKPADYWKAGDIWSAGCIFGEMLNNGAPLFDAKDKMSLLAKVASISETKPSQADKVRFPMLNSVPTSVKDRSLDEIIGNSPIDVSPDALDLLKQMLTFDPARRITAMDALQHRYFTSANLVDVPRSCPLGSELVDEEVPNFVVQYCGGV